MLDASFDLRWTASVVGAVPSSLALIANQRRAALRTALDELYLLGDDGTLVDVDTNNLWDNLASLLDVDVVTDMEVERTDEIFVIECGAAHRSTCQLYWSHISYRRHSTCATHLIGNFQ